MGLGSYQKGSGISTAVFFANKGANLLITDLRKKKELQSQLNKLKKFKKIKYILGKHSKEDFKKADLIFQNPSVPDTSPYLEIAKKNKIPIINDWTIFLDVFDNFLIGVTGTRGKSTTTTLIYEIIKSERKNVLLCGNIGNSPLHDFNQIKKDTIIVAELSSWLLRGFKNKSPNIGVLTNLMPDHQDKYKSLRDYYKDKETIFKFQDKNDYLILNKDNQEAAKRAKKIKSKIIWFSKKPSFSGAYIKSNSIFFKKEKICSLNDIQLLGDHNLENVLAAVAVSFTFGISKENIKKTLREFKGVHSRLEFIREVNGIKYYNDTTSTTPDGSIAALRALKKSFVLKKNIILLAGGHDKKLDFKEFAIEAEKQVKAIILFQGVASDKILKLLKGRIKEIIVINNMEQALVQANKRARRGDIVLLSPGAASFGLFKNEFDRGDQFVKLVKKI